LIVHFDDQAFGALLDVAHLQLAQQVFPCRHGPTVALLSYFESVVLG
jgi:hypothetical protein